MSCELQPLKVDAIGADLGKVLMGLLGEPGCGAAAKYLRQPHGHFGGDSPLLIDQFRQRCTRHSEGRGSLGDGQIQGLDALAQRKSPRGGEGSSLAWSVSSVVIDIMKFQCIAFPDAENHAPVTS